MFLIKYKSQLLPCQTSKQVQLALDMIWDIPLHVTENRMPVEGILEVFWSPAEDGETSHQIIVYNLGE